MPPEFSGIERRLYELSERLGRLGTLRDRARSEFDQDPFLRDIAERNLEVAAQCCIDICNKIISREQARKPADAHDAIVCMAELGVLEPEFARRFAPIAGFRNILVHEYVSIDWDAVYGHLQGLDDLVAFSEAVKRWLREKLGTGS